MAGADDFMLVFLSGFIVGRMLELVGAVKKSKNMFFVNKTYKVCRVYAN
jgi:hypothetical protein